MMSFAHGCSKGFFPIKKEVSEFEREFNKKHLLKKVTFQMNFLKCVWAPSLTSPDLITETPSRRLSHSFIMATESHYFPADWWSLPPNKQLPYYLSELHPQPFFLPLLANPSLHSPVPYPVPWGFPPPLSSATASINHSHLLSVQLLDLLMGGKPGLKWCTADFYTFPDCFQWEGKAIIPWTCPASIQHERLNAHHFHPRR